MSKRPEENFRFFSAEELRDAEALADQILLSDRDEAARSLAGFVLLALPRLRRQLAS